MTNQPHGSSDLDGVSADLLSGMHLTMLRIRVFEERVAELLEAREIKTATHLYIGQEAVAVGVCTALNRDDYVLGNHRSHGHYLAKGGDMSALMAELFCRVTGCARGRGGSMHLIAPEVGLLGTVPMVAATIPVAVGAALTSVLQGSERVAVAFFGDGATEEGVFHEAVNFAALERLPVVFVCENNLYSSHLPLRARRPITDLSQLAAPYGIAAIRVDGNQAAQVHTAARTAVTRARRGEGPTFLECLTYRWRGHVGPRWDLDVGIREQEELDYWLARCPIRNLEGLLLDQGILSAAEVAERQVQVRAEVETSVRFARMSPHPEPTEVYKHVFID